MRLCRLAVLQLAAGGLIRAAAACPPPQADALVSGGFLAAGYKTISIDDCWEQKIPERDAQGRLAPDPKRFPSGFKGLADYMHAKNVSFGIYSDMGTYTCGG